MELETFKNNLKELLSNSKLEETILMIQNRLNIDSTNTQEFILLRYNYSKLKQDRRKGIIKEEDLIIRENRLINSILGFISMLESNDFMLEEVPNRKTTHYNATGKLYEIRIPEFKNDFKSLHLIKKFDYSKVDKFSSEMYEVLITREDNILTYAGEQKVSFRKGDDNAEEIIIKEQFYGKGKIVGEYAYMNYQTKQVGGVIERSGQSTLNISDSQNIYGYFMTPDIELPGMFAFGRIEFKLIDE